MRVSKDPEIRKQEIIDVAMQSFLQKRDTRQQQ